MLRVLLIAVSCLGFSSVFSPLTAQPAKELFGSASGAASGPAAAFGGYAGGCLRGAVQLPIDGPGWQAMRLSRNRNWGHPSLITFLGVLAGSMRAEGYAGVLVGDLAQPRGGPMLTGHRSHQIGLDADIWFLASPERRLGMDEREELSAVSLLKPGTRELDPSKLTEREIFMLKTSAEQSNVARIFVHPAIKDGLCKTVSGDRDWLRKVRPWYGHHYHFHVRLSCPADSVGCQNQAPPPQGDGCGADLAWWLSDAAWAPSDTPAKPRPPLTLAQLPRACTTVLRED